MTYRADPTRRVHADATGIYVRGLRGERWAAIDMAELDLPSLIAFLRSGPTGGSAFAETCLALILGHERAAIDEHIRNLADDDHA